MKNPWGERLKLSVFVGSPRKGLEEPRERIIQAVLRAGHIPEGMELWGAGARPTLQEVSERLATCDLHVVLLGARYGSPAVKELGYTEWEYEQSRLAGRPILAFILDDDGVAKMWQENLPPPEEQQKVQLFRDKLRRTICNQYGDMSMSGIDRDVVVSINKAFDEENLPPDAGWIRARSQTATLLREIQSNRFVQRVLERVFDFRTLTGRVQTEDRSKTAAARLFWESRINQLRALKCYDLFIESGSSLAYVSQVFEDKVRNVDEPSWRVTTNNALALLQLLLFTDVDTRRTPPSAPDRADRYGAIFTRQSLNAGREPPDEPRGLFDDEKRAIEETVNLLKANRGARRLILAAASGWDTTHRVEAFRGLHVGSHANMLFKRAVFTSGQPVVLFLSRQKVDPACKESRFKCRKYDENPDGTTRYCYPVFGEELPLDVALRQTPLAICIGYEIDSEDESLTLADLRKRLEEVLRPVLSPHGFDLEYARKEFRSDLGELSGAFIAANERFIEIFPR
jgi:hypothetical protein